VSNDFVMKAKCAQGDLRYFAANRVGDELDPKKGEAWRQIAEEIKLVLPLYREKMHVIVHPWDKERCKDLAGLMKQGGTVNVDQISSGRMITSFLLEEIIRKAREWQQAGYRSWRPRFDPTGAALEMLVDNNPQDTVDAVILVGSVPYPALENYGINYAVVKGLFNAGVEPKPELALLPLGPEVCM